MKAIKWKNMPLFLKVLFVIDICALLYIWVHSLVPLAISAYESSLVTDIVTPALEVIVGENNVTNNLVRKLAHVFEFSLFSSINLIFMQLCYIHFKNVHYVKNNINTWKISALAALISLFVAIIDETIQIFSHRGAGMSDVLLDFSSSCITIILITIILIFCSKITSGGQSSI